MIKNIDRDFKTQREDTFRVSSLHYKNYYFKQKIYKGAT